MPADVWLRLPEDDDGLEAAAAGYYGNAHLLPVAGSQPAIQLLPAVLRGERVSLLAPGYAEHAHAWRERRAVAVGADGSPHYSFRGEGCADRLLHTEQLQPLPAGIRGIHFGSYSLVTPPIADTP